MEDKYITISGFEHAMGTLQRFFAHKHHVHATATAGACGLMSATDKEKLDRYPDNPVTLCRDNDGLTLRERRVDYVMRDNQLDRVIEYTKEGRLDFHDKCGCSCGKAQDIQFDAFQSVKPSDYDNQIFAPANGANTAIEFDAFRPVSKDEAFATAWL